jgi:hypothetical protein
LLIDGFTGIVLITQAPYETGCEVGSAQTHFAAYNIAHLREFQQSVALQMRTAVRILVLAKACVLPTTIVREADDSHRTHRRVKCNCRPSHKVGGRRPHLLVAKKKSDSQLKQADMLEVGLAHYPLIR